MTRFFRRVLAVISATVPALMLISGRLAFAASTGISAVDTSKSSLVTFAQGMAAIAAILLLAILIWDFLQHRNVGRSIFEVIGVVLLGALAVNAQSIAGTFGVNGAII